MVGLRWLAGWCSTARYMGNIAWLRAAIAGLLMSVAWRVEVHAQAHRPSPPAAPYTPPSALPAHSEVVPVNAAPPAGTAATPGASFAYVSVRASATAGAPAPSGVAAAGPVAADLAARLGLRMAPRVQAGQDLATPEREPDSRLAAYGEWWLRLGVAQPVAGAARVRWDAARNAVIVADDWQAARVVDVRALAQALLLAQWQSQGVIWPNPKQGHARGVFEAVWLGAATVVTIEYFAALQAAPVPWTNPAALVALRRAVDPVIRVVGGSAPPSSQLAQWYSYALRQWGAWQVADWRRLHPWPNLYQWLQALSVDDAYLTAQPAIEMPVTWHAAQLVQTQAVGTMEWFAWLRAQDVGMATAWQAAHGMGAAAMGWYRDAAVAAPFVVWHAHAATLADRDELVETILSMWRSQAQRLAPMAPHAAAQLVPTVRVQGNLRAWLSTVLTPRAISVRDTQVWVVYGAPEGRLLPP